MMHGPAHSPPASDDDPGSLGAAIEMVARSANVPIDGDAISATMGWPWLLCTGVQPTCPRTWHRLARDAFFIEAARTLGLSIRALHPPRAARGLETLVEFPQHFDASYMPLIRRALEHDQPVIIATPDAVSLGNPPVWSAIMPDETGGADALARSTSWASSVPTQVYVVERASPTGVDFDRLWTVILEHARRALSGEVDPGFDVVTGPKACDRWMSLLREEKPCPACAKPIESCHKVLAGAITRTHHRLIRLLDDHRDHIPARARELFATIEATSRDVIRALDPAEPPATIPHAAAAVADLRAALVRLGTALDARALVEPR